MGTPDTSILLPLEPWLFGRPPTLPGFDGLLAVHGKRFNLLFIVTMDHDGQVEASFSRADGRRGPPSKGLCDAFFKAWGVKPLEGLRLTGNRHYVVRRGTIH